MRFQKLSMHRIRNLKMSKLERLIAEHCPEGVSPRVLAIYVKHFLLAFYANNNLDYIK
jgi:hypothetical protein